jgi:hypothetical protein
MMADGVRPPWPLLALPGSPAIRHEVQQQQQQQKFKMGQSLRFPALPLPPFRADHANQAGRPDPGD